jgi:hypothetical protein
MQDFDIKKLNRKDAKSAKKDLILLFSVFDGQCLRAPVFSVVKNAFRFQKLPHKYVPGVR